MSQDPLHDHDHDHDHGARHGQHGDEAHDEPHDETAMADLLDLDAEVNGSWMAAVTEWLGTHVVVAPRTVVDVGAGTGSGAMALARRFPAAEVVAVDASTMMLERLRAAALEHGLADRVRAVQADLDLGWPDVGAVDLVWAASSLHHVAGPDRLFRDVHAALGPGGLLVAVEMDSLPRFLPDEIGLGRPGLEARCHRALAEANWNAHPDWRPHLERAGFEVAEQRTFTTEITPDGTSAPSARAYAHTYLRRIRSALDGRLTTDDSDALDRLLSTGSSHSLLRRRDLILRSSRTAWAARRH